METQTPTYGQADRVTHLEATGPKPPDQQHCYKLIFSWFHVWIVTCMMGRFVCVGPLVSIVSSWFCFVFNKRLKSLSSSVLHVY